MAEPIQSNPKLKRQILKYGSLSYDQRSNKLDEISLESTYPS